MDDWCLLRCAVKILCLLQLNVKNHNGSIRIHIHNQLLYCVHTPYDYNLSKKVKPINICHANSFVICTFCTNVMRWCNFKQQTLIKRPDLHLLEAQMTTDQLCIMMSHTINPKKSAWLGSFCQLKGKLRRAKGALSVMRLKGRKGNLPPKVCFWS